MQEALETLKPEYWQAKEGPPKSRFMQMTVETMKELKRRVDGMVFPATVVLEKALNGIDHPVILASALPFVREMRLERALGELSSIPEGQDLVESMPKGVKMELTGDPRMSGGRNNQANCVSEGELKVLSRGIEVDAYTSTGYMIGVLAHELQHQKQVNSDTIRMTDKIPSPIESVWYERLIEADACAVAADIAWKLKETGKPEAWREAGGFGKTIAKAYQDEVTKDPEAANDGRAKRAAFDAWFSDAPWRAAAYNSQGLGNALHEFQMDQLAKGGMPMDSIKVSDIEKLGELSSGPNYLKLEGARPLDDPYYRAPNWNKDQAMRLGQLHDKYDSLKQESGSKFVSKGTVCEDAANTASARSVSRARPGSMKL